MPILVAVSRGASSGNGSGTAFGAVTRGVSTDEEEGEYMNDLVSEYQQYQDATAEEEGEFIQNPLRTVRQV